MDKEEYRVCNILVGYKDSYNTVTAMEFKCLLHYVPVTLLHQQTGLSNLTDMVRTHLHGFYMDEQCKICTGPVSQMEHPAAAKDTPGRDLE